MTRCPRRTLLRGIGATAAVSMASVAASAAEDDAESADRSFESLRSFLPASVESETMTVSIVDFERQLEADEPHERAPLGGQFRIEPETVSKSALVYTLDESYSRPIKVLTGDVELEGDAESERSYAGIEYERYETDDAVAAVTDDVVVIAEDAETIENALAAGAGDADRLLEAKPVLEEGLEAVENADSRTIHVTDDHHVVDDDVETEYVVHASTVLDPDTIEMTVGIELADAAAVTDELVETLTAELAYTPAEPSVDVDGSFVAMTYERDLEAERAANEHDSPGFLRVDRDFDLDDEYLEIEIGRGDPTPIEDLTLEVDDEEYDRDVWADGHGTLEEGDTIRIEMDDVEPALSVRLSHDHELGSSGSGTTILNHFRFEFAHDFRDETLAVEYADDFPLDGDRVHLAVYDHDDAGWVRPDEDEPEPRITAQPWDGETVSEGDRHVLEDVRPGDELVVGWDGTSRRDGVGRYQVAPPGTAAFEYDYDDRTLSATLEPPAEDESDDPQPAAGYELRIDEEQATSQWADDVEFVPAEGTTITVDDVDVGAHVTAVWGDDELYVSGTRAMPSVELEVDDGTVEHVGGDALPASSLEVEGWTEDETVTTSLADEVDGEFDEGSAFEVDDDVQHLTLVYDDEHRIGWANTTRE
ncbi:hypothetical protein [Natrarchaeobius oligotrophus]|uniref:Uncharacterized protein n=1 Tax=Natrarchaeobius chitinivorans TaxID=1679083 RepID=A0A3N6N2I3_NATCH|nr:hypothetical protein [Natrarchaeobius chitinivorans]RQH01847.1 hypothetical protein EA472_05925 [Natrarchaeobius chitinivorans]